MLVFTQFSAFRWFDLLRHWDWLFFFVKFARKGKERDSIKRKEREEQGDKTERRKRCSQLDDPGLWFCWICFIHFSRFSVVVWNSAVFARVKEKQREIIQIVSIRCLIRKRHWTRSSVWCFSVFDLNSTFDFVVSSFRSSAKGLIQLVCCCSFRFIDFCSAQRWTKTSQGFYVVFFLVGRFFSLLLFWWNESGNFAASCLHAATQPRKGLHLPELNGHLKNWCECACDWWKNR